MFETTVAGKYVPISLFISVYMIGISASLFILIALKQPELSRKRRILEFLIN